jgi:hypothetical protein
MQIKEHIMKTRNIEHINHAVVVLRHFIELSSKLLPFLDELNNKQHLNEVDQHDREKIIEAYRSYDFDPTTSEALMGSPILFLIRANFEKLIRNQNDRRSMREFKLELNRLRKNWQLIDAN